MTDKDMGEDVEEYPPDSTDEADEWEDAPGNDVPQPRSAAVRARAHGQLQASRPRNKKDVKRVKKASSRILSQQKRRQALELRKAGVTYEDIAQKVGYYDASSARKAVLKAYNSIHQEPVRELKIVQTERLNMMLMALWSKVQVGDEVAINTALRVMAQLDDLQGTRAAQQVEVKQTGTTGVLVVDGSKDDFIASLRKMAGIQHDGTNFPPGTAPAALGAGSGAPAAGQGIVYPPGMFPAREDDVVDAELVEGDGSLYDALGEEGRAAVRAVMAEPVQEAADPHVISGETPEVAGSDTPKKKFSFGVDPTVKR